MAQKITAKDWDKLLAKDLPEMKTNSNDVDWIFDFLGWNKNARNK